jgi:hypothetical protein
MEAQMSVIWRMSRVPAEFIKGPYEPFVTQTESSILFCSDRDWIREFTGEAGYQKQRLARYVKKRIIARSSSSEGN